MCNAGSGRALGKEKSQYAHRLRQLNILGSQYGWQYFARSTGGRSFGRHRCRLHTIETGCRANSRGCESPILYIPATIDSRLPDRWPSEWRRVAGTTVESALLRTANVLKRIPSDLPPIDWIPVDNVATVMDTFVLRHARETAQVFNICPSKGQS